MEAVKKGMSVSLDEKNSIAILEPYGSLSENDFKEASEKIDSFLEKNKTLNGIIIYAKDFPYWDSFSAFMSHFKFIKNHQKKVAYLAFVTDATIGILVEHIGDYFVHAKIRNFDYEELEKAKKWILSDEDGIIKHKFYVNVDSLKQSGYIEIKIIGTLTHDDYSKAIPILDSTLDKLNGKQGHILLDMTDFEGWELRAAWDDFKFGLKHSFNLGKIAIVGNNKKWIEYTMKISSWFIRGEIKQFEDKKEAVKWLEE